MSTSNLWSFDTLVRVVIFVATAGAIGIVWEESTSWWRERKEQHRLKLWIRDYVDSARDIAAHNIRSLDFARTEQPYAFVRFPVEQIEALAFGGQVRELSAPEGRRAVLHYLTQARHVNSMMDRLDATIFDPAVTHRLKGPLYEVMRSHFDGDIVMRLDELEMTLGRD